MTARNRIVEMENWQRQLEHFVTVAEERVYSPVRPTAADLVIRASSLRFAPLPRDGTFRDITVHSKHPARRTHWAASALLDGLAAHLASAAAAQNAVAAVRGLVRGRARW